MNEEMTQVVGVVVIVVVKGTITYLQRLAEEMKERRHRDGKRDRFMKRSRRRRKEMKRV